MRDGRCTLFEMNELETLFLVRISFVVSRFSPSKVFPKVGGRGKKVNNSQNYDGEVF